MVERLPEMQETQVRSLGQDDPQETKWQPTLALWPGKFHGWRSLVGYSPWGRKELDTTERFHLVCKEYRKIGKGCSMLWFPFCKLFAHILDSG